MDDYLEFFFFFFILQSFKSVEILEWKGEKGIWKRKISYFEGNHLLSKGRT